MLARRTADLEVERLRDALFTLRLRLWDPRLMLRLLRLCEPTLRLLLCDADVLKERALLVLVTGLRVDRAAVGWRDTRALVAAFGVFDLALVAAFGVLDLALVLVFGVLDPTLVVVLAVIDAICVVVRVFEPIGSIVTYADSDHVTLVADSLRLRWGVFPFTPAKRTVPLDLAAFGMAILNCEYTGNTE